MFTSSFIIKVNYTVVQNWRYNTVIPQFLFVPVMYACFCVKVAQNPKPSAVPGFTISTGCTMRPYLIRFQVTFSIFIL